LSVGEIRGLQFAPYSLISVVDDDDDQHTVGGGVEPDEPVALP
jgi:hypothetical protein